MALKQILVPVDFSRHSKSAANVGIEFATKFGAHLILVHVLEPLHVTFGEIFPSEVPDKSRWRAHAEAKMKELVTSLGEASVESLLLEGLAWSAICEFSEREMVDLIIIPSHGYRGLMRFVLGSTAERVVRHARCSVLVMKPDGDKSAPD
jgi:nucleotide-binding universal stress UspA family protein